MKQIIALGIGTIITLGVYAEAAPSKSAKQGVPVSSSARAQAEKILKRGKVAEAKSTATNTAQLIDDKGIVLDMPDRKKTMRRKLLFSFGLFGMGVRFGWNKPKQEIVMENGQPSVKSKGVGSPIMTFSVGRKELGLGADNIPPEMRSKMAKDDKEKMSEAESTDTAL